MATTPTVGSRVTHHKGRTGTVVHVGRCGHPPCPWGEACVTIRPEPGQPGSFTTINVNAAELTVVEA